MRIAIYGDSFAEPCEESNHFAWFNLLQDFVPNSVVRNFSLGATSVYYSYREFLQTYSQFDTIIFLVTEPNRYTKKMKNIVGKDRFFCNLMQVDWLSKSTDITIEDKLTLEYLKGWFMMEDTEYASHMTELMMEKMASLHEKIIFFPCFANSLSFQQSLKYGVDTNCSMVKFLNYQTNDVMRIDVDFAELEENTKLMACHFTEEFNIAIAKAFSKKILTNTWDWSDLLNIKTLKYDSTQYYIKREQ